MVVSSLYVNVVSEVKQSMLELMSSCMVYRLVVSLTYKAEAKLEVTSSKLHNILKIHCDIYSYLLVVLDN